MKEINIVIHPPYWTTWRFREALGLLLLAVMAIAINQYNRKKYS